MNLVVPDQWLLTLNSISQRIEKGIEHLDGFSQGSDQKVDCNGVGGLVAPYNCTLSKSVVEEQLDGFQDWKSMPREPRARGPIVEAKILPDGKPYTADSSIYDVKIEVKANYRPQHVPLVSLMSKLNGKAIIGHPLTVQVLSDDYYGSLPCEAAVECTEIGPAVKRNSEGGRVPTTHMRLHSRFPPRKSAKAKKSGLLSEKIRKLSSLTGQKLGLADRKLVVEKPKGPVRACVLLKLVFSRIDEALNGSARRPNPPFNVKQFMSR
ncbi:Tudor/PWWP/MBT superfamily protein [Theobroma cacao]|uniref:Tudor/PWWP/MBT superfamily protein n=1 Tax=Theobroma cacao TaxID=3641 RepID=A0A061E2P7_THECC|nr:Tudor/PWWP/MBT superfamily protein [Theobroma cacao]